MSLGRLAGPTPRAKGPTMQGVWMVILAVGGLYWAIRLWKDERDHEQAPQD